MYREICAIFGIIFLLAAGILDSLEGGWKMLVLSIIYGIGNTLIFLIK